MGTSVLVVDDDPGARGVLAATLAAEGYGVVLAAGGDEAMESLASFPVDLVLLDQEMPGLGGVEVLRRLRAMPATRRLPVILVTGQDGVDDRVAGLAAGADDYVIKPFEPSELVARVATQLRNHEAWQQVVDGHLEERAAIARVLQHVASAGTLDERAAAVCDALIEVQDVDGVMLIVFDGEASASVMGAAGNAPWTIGVGEHLPYALARYLAMRGGIGAWLEQRDGLDLETDGRLLPIGTAACAPIGGRGDLVGLLAMGVQGDPSRALAAAIDFATMTLALLRPELDLHRRAGAERAIIEELLTKHAFTPHFQPIVDLSIDGGDRVVGVEALTRFADGSSPELRFRQAAIVGLGHEFERATMQAALEAARRLPDDRWLSVNVSPTMTLGLDGELFDVADRPVVLELSEQEAVHDYGGLRAALDRMGPTVRLSVDDAGSGFASLRHILALQPEFVKLDRSWVRNVDEDLPRQALIAGLCSFCERTGAGLIAEGIETPAELETIRRLGVAFGQGFLLGYPEPADTARPKARAAPLT